MNPHEPDDPHDPDQSQLGNECETDGAGDELAHDAQPPADAAPELDEHDLFGKPPPIGKTNWDHRRAEPRMLALLWTIYLFVATLMTFASAGVFGYITSDSYRPSAKSLLLLIFLGATLVWPMLRLTQITPDEPTKRACFKDAMVIILPAQAIVWPQMFLAHWPFEVLLVATITLSGWSLLVGVLLAWALDGRCLTRSGWAAALIVLAAVVPVLIMVRAAVSGGFADTQGVRWLWMGSPWTVPFELTRDRVWTGAAAVVLPGHRIAAWITLAVGLAAWFVPMPTRRETRRIAD